MVKSGKINIKIEESQQQNHQSTKAWKNQVKQALAPNSSSKLKPKSLLDSKINPQKFVEEYCGTGKIEFSNKNIIVHEFVKVPYVVGRTFDTKKRKYIPTHTIQIKYTNGGVHLFPTVDKQGEKNE